MGECRHSSDTVVIYYLLQQHFCFLMYYTLQMEGAPDISFSVDDHQQHSFEPTVI